MLLCAYNEAFRSLAWRNVNVNESEDRDGSRLMKKVLPVPEEKRKENLLFIRLTKQQGVHYNALVLAGLAEWVDARDLKSCGRRSVRVRVPRPAPQCT